jgi:hypothetical protein
MVGPSATLLNPLDPEMQPCCKQRIVTGQKVSRRYCIGVWHEVSKEVENGCRSLNFQAGHLRNGRMSPAAFCCPYSSLRPTAAHRGPPRPTAAHHGPPRPTAAPPRPTEAHCSPPWPTAAHCGRPYVRNFPCQTLKISKVSLVIMGS